MNTSNLKPMNLRPEPDFNKVGSVVKAFSAKHNVGAMSFPREEAGEVTAVTSKDDTVTQPGGKVAATPLKRLAVELPAYLVDDIHERALGSTARYVVLDALKKAGFHVAAADLVQDGRRGK